MTSITSNVAHLVVSPKVHCYKNEKKVLLHFGNQKYIAIQILCEINFDRYKASEFLNDFLQFCGFEMFKNEN